MVSYQHKYFQQLFISIWSPCTVHRMVLFSLQKRCPWEFLTLVPPGRPAKTQRQVLHSGAWQENKRWWPKVEKKGEIPSSYKHKERKKKKKKL